MTKVPAQDSRLTQAPYITQPLKIDPVPTGAGSRNYFRLH